MKYTGVISLDLGLCAASTGLKLYQLSGNNTGNLLFTSAVYTQLKNPERLNQQESISALRERFENICIPAANWIYPKFEFQWLADLLENLNLPVCCVGLGAQIDETELQNLTPGTRRFLHVLSHLSKSIGVRGQHTANLLEKIGIKNVEVLGCPSLFPSFNVPKIRFPDDFSPWSIGGSFTRFSLSPGREDPFQIRLARYLFEFADRIIYQSEIEEIRFLADEVDVDAKLAEFYGHPISAVRQILRQKGRCYASLQDWLKGIESQSVFVTSRIHGCVVAVLAGCPSILLTHDHRTRELADSMALASVPIETANLDELFDAGTITKIIEHYRTVEPIWTRNRDRLVDFYLSNNVQIRRS